VRVDQLRDARFGSIGEAAAGCTALATALRTAEAQTRSAVIGALHASGWAGADADAASASLGRLPPALNILAVSVDRAAARLRTAQDELTSCQGELRRLLAAADSAGCEVSGSGTARPRAAVTATAAHGGGGSGGRGGRGTAASAEAAFDEQRAIELSDLIATVLRQAEEADLRCAAALRSSAAGVRLPSSAGAGAGGVFPPPSGAAPAAVAAWWAGLEPAAREGLLKACPERLGALDGLPAAVRDRANRTVLESVRRTLLERISRLEPASKVPGVLAPAGTYATAAGGEHNRIAAETAALRNRLATLDALAARLASSRSGSAGNGLPGLHLLAFDPSGDGRAVIARGDPGTARHIAVHVPGTGAELAGIGHDLDRSDALWAAGTRLAAGAPLATVTWLGYDAPDTIPEAVFRHPAEAGGPRLDRFVDGLRAAAQQESGSPGSPTPPTPPAHLTVIGHSYGSTLLGAADRAGDGLAADDVIVAGSPGMTVDRASELHLNARHIWAEAAEGDPVPHAGAPFLSGHGGLPLALRPEDAPGTAPSDQEFGANRLATDTRGHSAYWEEDSLSLENQARVVTGRYDETVLEQGTRPE
jgi:hypothetical protein